MTGDFGLLEPVAAGRACAATDDTAVVGALLEAELAWIGVLDGVESERAAALAVADRRAAGAFDPARLASAARSGGNPVIPLVAELRQHLGTAMPVHRGLTSQDVLDTALMMLARRVADEIAEELDGAAAALARLAEQYAQTPQVGRTLGQHAVPITFGAKAAGWRQGIDGAARRLASAATPVQFGGAAGTNAAVLAIGADPVQAGAEWARQLGLSASEPWHTSRGPVVEVGDALAAVCAAAGRIANDVIFASRPEVGELAESALARGGSSTMPHKRNPVLSVLIRSAAISAPGHAGVLQLAAGLAEDERSTGAWHAEWPALRSLLRLALGAAVSLRELCEHLRVFPERMAERVSGAAPLLVSERLMITLAGRAMGGRAAVQEAIDAAVAAPADSRAAVLRDRIAVAVPDLTVGELDDLLAVDGYLGTAPQRAHAAGQRPETNGVGR
ncbi:lyase family protein [Tsukamurella strandjordii]|uniref:lyase family protein n=1 Tax=Tsukamurella strandjordii TaxID=147577 RepID=UPI0031E05888